MKPPKPLCGIAGCEVESRYKGLCYLHYVRALRNSPLKNVPHRRQIKGQPSTTVTGYILVYAPDHPLKRFNRVNHQLEHRVVFYERHQEGPFTCHWCCKPVTWDIMHVDHLNENRVDNRIDNLVASCRHCNLQRNRNKWYAGVVNGQRCRRLTYNGETLMLGDWAKRLGISRVALYLRLKTWPIEEALSIPKRQRSKVERAA